MKQRKRIGELMVEVGLITPAQLQHALAVQAKHKGRLGDVLLSEGLITEEQLIEVLDCTCGAGIAEAVLLLEHHIEGQEGRRLCGRLSWLCSYALISSGHANVAFV